MKNLILIRHGKSDYPAFCDDFDRPLLPGGKSDASLVAREFLGQLPVDYCILCSPAKRALDTAQIFVQVWNYPLASVELIDSLYTFELSRFERVVKSLPDEIFSVIIFGHNEAITNFVNKFGDARIENVPTSGLVSLRFDSASWSAIDKGWTDAVIFPRELRR